MLKKVGRSNVFYFLQKSGAPINMKVGDIFNFAKTGNAAVKKIDPSAPNTNGTVSVFVSMDNDIDPVSDGYPNKIFVQFKVIQPL